MELKIDYCSFNADGCEALVFKGKNEDGIEKLIEQIKKDDFNSDINDEGDNKIISVYGFDDKLLEAALKYVSDYPALKAVAFFDEFQPGHICETYVAYSEAGESEFTKCESAGSCDGDCPLSGEADILQEEPVKYSGTYSSTGRKWSITYSFPYVNEWNGIEDSEAETCSDYSVENGAAVFPDGIKEIADNAFENCDELTTVVIPDGVKKIGRGAFRRCSNLESVTIPEGVTEIEADAFSSCPKCKNVTIPTSVTKIGDFAFNGYLSNYMTGEFFIVNGILVCSGYQSGDVKVPEGVIRINENAFSVDDEGLLHSVTLPEGLKEIGDWAFGGKCGLEYVTIPESVTFIAEDAFDGCGEYCDFKIRAPKGSYAEKYAEENYIPFEAID